MRQYDRQEGATLSTPTPTTRTPAARGALLPLYFVQPTRTNAFPGLLEQGPGLSHLRINSKSHKVKREGEPGKK